MPEQLPESVRDLSPGARLIYRVLEDSPMAIEDIESETALSARSIYDCTRALEEAGEIEIRPHPNDARKRIYERQ